MATTLRSTPRIKWSLNPSSLMCFWMASTWASVASVFITMIMFAVSFDSGGGAFRSRPALSRAPLKVGPQDPGAVHINVDDVAGPLLRVHVDENAQAQGEGAGYVHLVSAEEGHVSPAHLPGGESGEFGVEVRAGCEEGGGHVFGVYPIRLHHRSQELGCGGQDGLAGVGLDGGGAADASSQHDDIAGARPATAGEGRLTRAQCSGPRAATIRTAGRSRLRSRPSGLIRQLSAGR